MKKPTAVTLMDSNRKLRLTRAEPSSCHGSLDLPGEKEPCHHARWGGGGFCAITFPLMHISTWKFLEV